MREIIFLTNRKYVYKDPATPECTLVDSKGSVGSPSIREFCFRKPLSRRANIRPDPAAEDLQNAFPYESKPESGEARLVNARDRQEIVARVKLRREQQ